MALDWLRVASNGAADYLPPFLVLIFFGGVGDSRVQSRSFVQHRSCGDLCWLRGLRVINPLVCDPLPFDTHFMWHVLNVLMLGMLLASITRYGKPRTGQASDGNRLRMTADRTLSGQ